MNLNPNEKAVLLAIAMNGMQGNDSSEPRQLLDDNYSWFSYTDMAFQTPFGERLSRIYVDSLAAKGFVTLCLDEPRPERKEWLHALTVNGIELSQALWEARPRVYKAKSSAIRAAKRAVEDYEVYEVTGGWTWKERFEETYEEAVQRALPDLMDKTFPDAQTPRKTGVKGRKGAVQACWNIFAANRDARRKDAIQLCVDAGLNFHTARTQYQLWNQTQKRVIKFS